MRGCLPALREALEGRLGAEHALVVAPLARQRELLMTIPECCGPAKQGLLGERRPVVPTPRSSELGETQPGEILSVQLPIALTCTLV
jgi:hypothetical protein